MSMLKKQYNSKAARRKVAYVLTPITFGGSDKVSLNFLKAVNFERLEIRPVLLTRPWEEETFFEKELHRLGMAFDTVPVALRPDRDSLRVPRVFNRLYSILERGAFDVIHTHGYFADICGITAGRLLGIDTLSTCHGFISNDLKLKIYNLLDTSVLRLCKTVIAVSEGIKTELIDRGIDESRILVIPNAVASSNEGDLHLRRWEKRRALDIAPEDLVVGYLGRLSPEKGVMHLVQAAADLYKSSTPVKLLLVGDGSERTSLQKLVNDSGLDATVHFAGFQTDIENWLPAFDILVLPSLTEGTPMALLEAMAAGVPVIATCVGGVPKVVTNGINGLLVPPGDAGAIKEKIQLLRKSAELYWTIGRAGRDTIRQKYDIDAWARSITYIYHGSEGHRGGTQNTTATVSPCHPNERGAPCNYKKPSLL